MKKTLFTFASILLAAQAMAQETLSLAQCLQMGIERNLNLKTYEGNVLKGKHNISENRSRLLPQINIGAALNDNFTPPVSVTDGRAYGKPYNVTKTLQYSSSASLQLQMPLYSQTALTALEISKTLDQLNSLSYEKAREDLIVQISKMYYLAQNTEEQIGIIKDNIKRLEELRDITECGREACKRKPGEPQCAVRQREGDAHAAVQHDEVRDRLSCREGHCGGES